MRRWITLWLVTIMVMGAVAMPAAAQYADVLLPQGVLQVTVEDQPINAVTAPVIGVTNPRVAGSLGTGNITIELAIADAAGSVIRFPAEVNRRGAFRQRPPENLAPGGTYSLYINDVLIGQFSVAADAAGGDDGDRPTTTSTLDLARLMAFPQDAGEAVPNLGLVPELSRAQPIAELARQIAQDANNNTGEGRQQARDELTAAGFVQRYQGSLAVPAAADPTVFEVQIASIVTEYDSPESAAAAFAASATGGEDVESATIGDESRLSRTTAIATQTNTEYQSLQLLFRQDRLLIVINYADLLNRAPEQSVVEAMGQAVQQRVTAVLAGESDALTTQSLTISTTGVPRSNTQQYYEAIDGALVPLFNETTEARAVRLANLTGATEASTSRLVSRGPGDGQQGGNVDQTAAPFLYGVNMIAFPGADEAASWLEGLPERITADPLTGYLSFAPLEGAPTYGDRSVTYQSTQQLTDETAAGYRTYVQVGDRIAVIELAAVPAATEAVLTSLVNSQVACLTAGGPCAEISAPPELVAATDGGNGADPGSNTTGDAAGDTADDTASDTTDETAGDTTDPGDDQAQPSDLPTGIQRETPEAD